MNIRLAAQDDLRIVSSITENTIREIYPRYYPQGAVDFFLEHHKNCNILSDIQNQNVFLLSASECFPIGTVTIRKNEICRLFVLPDMQGKGYGRELLNFAENAVFKKYNEIILDASLPAKAIYLKRGYSCIDFHTILTENNDYLCYDVMRKER